MTKLLGYNGKIAYIDLNGQTVQIEDLNPSIAENYIGGVGLSAKIIYDLFSEEDYGILKQDRFASINTLVFATGPLTGTTTPSSSRYSVSGISPLTGIWGESTSGGFFPVALRKCGYDALVITGDAEKPVLIYVNNEKIEIKDANPVWGKNTRETIDSIRKSLDDEKLRIACIGNSGENLVKYSCIINDEGRAAGRCGFGALMGKKKLKAIAIRGNKKIDYSDRNAVIESGKSALHGIHNAFSTNFFSNHGTLCYTDMGMVIGDVPSKYFTSTDFIAESLTGMALKEQFPVLKYACSGCTIGCGRTTIVKTNEGEIEIDGPEYETVAAYGPLCGVIKDFNMILKANHLCNLEGLDTISSGVSIAFLIYLVENKISLEKISKKLTDLKLEEIRWGNEDVIIKLLNKIIRREGIGDILAEGVKIIADNLDVDPELAAHVKGLEIPMHDPRAYHGQALTYMTSCIGASHEKGDFFNIDGNAASFTKIRKDDRFDINGRENSVILLQDLTNIYDSAVICNFPHIPDSILGRSLKASTGFSSLSNRKKLFMVGERANNLKRLISFKLGCKREDDNLPKIVTQTLESGGSIGQKLDLKENLKKYYEIRGWDWQTGCPTEDKLRELDIL